MSFVVCVSSFAVLMALYYRSMDVRKTSCHCNIYTNNQSCRDRLHKWVWLKPEMYKRGENNENLSNLKIKLNIDQCLSDKIWGNYYTKHSVLQSWRKLFFFVWHYYIMSDRNWGCVLPMGFVCLSHHFFVILYITCQIFFFSYTELNARLPILMIIKQLN